MPTFSYCSCWWKTPSSSDSKLIHALVVERLRGQAVLHLTPLPGVELEEPIARFEDIGKPLGVGFEDRHPQVRIAVQEPRHEHLGDPDLHLVG